MTSTTFRVRAHRRRHAFSIIELLSVVALMSLMLGFAGPAWHGVVGSSALDTGTRTLVDLLSAARSQAIAAHTLVRVAVARDWDGHPDSNLRRASVWSYDPAAEQFFQDTPWYDLPAGVVLEASAPDYLAGASYASADRSSVHGDFPLSPAAASGDFTLPTRDGVQIVSRYLEFLPDGSVRMEGGTRRNIILVVTQGFSRSVDVVTHTECPGGHVANWAQINADTLTGRVRVYRP